MPLAASFDTPGWFTRDERTFERVGDAILGEDPHPLAGTPRLLKAEDCFGLAEDAPVRQLETLLGRIDRMLRPIQGTTVAAPDFDALYWAFRWLQGVESWRSHGAFITAFKPALGPGIGERFEYGRTVTEKDARKAAPIRESFRRHLGLLLGADGVLILPTVPGPRAAAGRRRGRAGDLAGAVLAAAVPLGAVRFPAGLDPGGRA